MTTPTAVSGPTPQVPDDDITPVQAVPEMTAADRQKALNEVYTASLKQLRDQHLDEFNQLRKKGAAARGIDWSPKLTPEQAAAKQIRELAAKHNLSLTDLEEDK